MSTGLLGVTGTLRSADRVQRVGLGARTPPRSTSPGKPVNSRTSGFLDPDDQRRRPVSRRRRGGSPPFREMAVPRSSTASSSSGQVL